MSAAVPVAAAQETSVNIASHLPAMAKSQPKSVALILPDGGTMTFAELDARSDAYAHGLERAGIRRGVRTVLMVPPDREFFPLVFALFKVGAVLVLIDPGIGRGSLLKCLDEVEPEAFVGVPKAHLARLLFRHPFRHVHTLVTVGRRWFWGGHTLQSLREAGGVPTRPYAMTHPSPEDTAAILFTSGSTGIPKGAVYTHGIFDAQVRSIRDTYSIRPGEIDLPTFPLFALFDPALGMTAVIPDMDFRAPAKADPAMLVRLVQTHAVTSMFGSPALLDALGRHGEKTGATLPTVRRVLSAGAPVRTDVLERLTKMLPKEAEIFTPFGATESLPVASIGSKEALGDTAAGTAEGKGVCVGRPVDGATVRIIRVTDEAIPSWSDSLLSPPGETGEITVRGPMVTREYYARPEQTRLSKIDDGGRVVHRMGDVGWIDERGRLWMCGRKGQRVVTAKATLFTVPIEEVFNTHPDVLRSALVGVGERGRQIPVLVVEREKASTMSDDALRAELLAKGSERAVTVDVGKVLFYEGSFPVDVRHNAKIERESLARWAAGRVST